MAQYFYYPPVGGSSSANASVGPNGTAIPTSSTLIAGKNGSGVLTPVSVDSSGDINVNVISSTLPTGSATAANQVTGNNSLASIDGKTPALGQALSAASVPVVLTAAQLTTLTPLTSVTVTQVTGTNLHTVVDSGSITVTSSTLPTGAATSANQTTEIASLATIATNTSATQGTAAAGTAATKSDLVGGVFNTSLPTLTTGQQAALQMDSSARQIIAPLTNASVVKAQLQDNAGTAIVLGQTTASASVPVVLASNQTSLTTTQGGRAKANTPTFNDYTATNVTTAAYVQLIASTTSTTNLVEVFDSSGQTMILAVGGSGSEVDQFFIFPGGNGDVPLAIPAGSRISIKAKTATANVGYIALNLYT